MVKVTKTRFLGDNATEKIQDDIGLGQLIQIYDNAWVRLYTNAFNFYYRNSFSYHLQRFYF